MILFPAFGVFTMVLLIGASYAHRDGEGSLLSTSESEQGIRMNQEDAKLWRHRMQRHKIQHHQKPLPLHPLQPDMESLEADCKAITDPDSMGIEALKKCVSSLEVYAGKVRTHEKKYVVSHGKYSNAFIRTYALLKSILDNDKQLHKYRTTFVSNHTQAGKYLQQELANVKNSVDEIGAHWQERDLGADAVRSSIVKDKAGLGLDAYVVDSNIPEYDEGSGLSADALDSSDPYDDAEGGLSPYAVDNSIQEGNAGAAADFDQPLADPDDEVDLQAAADGHLESSGM